MLELDLKTFMDFLDQNNNQMDSDRRKLHYLEEKDKFTLFIKSFDLWEYFTVIPKSEIFDFGTQYEVSEEQAVNDFKRNFLHQARPLKEHVPEVQNLPEPIEKTDLWYCEPEEGQE